MSRHLSDYICDVWSFLEFIGRVPYLCRPNGALSADEMMIFSMRLPFWGLGLSQISTPAFTANSVMLLGDGLGVEKAIVGSPPEPPL